MSPRPFTALATAFALAVAALAPSWGVPAGPRAPTTAAKSGSIAGGACCGDTACCESGGACGSGACATETPAALNVVPASAPSTHSARGAVSPIPADCPRLTAGCGAAALAVMAGTFDPVIRDDAAAAPDVRAAERATQPAAPAPRRLSRDPQEPPPRA